VRMWE